MAPPLSTLPPGELDDALEATLRHAEACGALRPIRTEYEIVPDGGIDFMVKWAPSLAEKARKPVAGEKDARNPFLPYERDLFVGHVAPDHVALLNKFPVLRRHLLIVTRDFQSQETLLTPGDFEALCWGLEALDGLVFYNGGAQAGASQPHKHLQLIPRALDGSPGLPVEAVLGQALPADPDGLSRLPVFPFRHALAMLPAQGAEPAGLYALYRRLLTAAGISVVDSPEGAVQSGPYNLLVTRRWMLVVPRAREAAEGISINALGFAGSLFTPRARLLPVIEETGPLGLLTRVCPPEA